MLVPITASTTSIDGDIGLGIGTNPFGLQSPSVGERDGDLVCVLYHVIAGDEETLARIDNHPRPGGAYLTLSRKFGNVEEAAQERMVEKRIAFLGNTPLSRDVNDARRDFLYQRGKCRHATATRRRA